MERMDYFIPILIKSLWWIIPCIGAVIGMAISERNSDDEVL